MSSWPQGFSTLFTSTANRSRSSRFGDSLCTCGLSQAAASGQNAIGSPPCREEIGMRRDELLRDAQILQRVDGEPDPAVAVRGQPALGGELGKGGALVVAALRQPGDRLLAEDVDPATGPIGKSRRLLEAGHCVLGT